MYIILKRKPGSNAISPIGHRDVWDIYDSFAGSTSLHPDDKIQKSLRKAIAAYGEDAILLFKLVPVKVTTQLDIPVQIDSV